MFHTSPPPSSPTMLTLEWCWLDCSRADHHYSILPPQRRLIHSLQHHPSAPLVQGVLREGWAAAAGAEGHQPAGGAVGAPAGGAARPGGGAGGSVTLMLEISRLHRHAADCLCCMLRSESDCLLSAHAMWLCKKQATA